MKNKFFKQISFSLFCAAVSLISFLDIAKADPSPAPVEIVFATPAATYPYNFGAADGCTDPRGVCGFEIDLMDAICRAMGVQSRWIIRPWNGSNLEDPTSLLGGLTAPGSTEDYIAINTTSTNAKRRLRLLSSAHYMSAQNLFIGPPKLTVQFDKDGFPTTQQTLKIGVLKGNLEAEVRAHYAVSGLGNLEIVPYDQFPENALANGDVDILYAFDGIPQMVEKKFPGRFQIIGTPIKEWSDDPYNFVAAMGRVDLKTLDALEIINQGLIKIRRSGEYLQISEKWFGPGRDLWSVQGGPQLTEPAPPPQPSSCSSFLKRLFRI